MNLRTLMSRFRCKPARRLWLQDNLLVASRRAQLLQGVLKDLQVLPHLAQRILDPAGLIQDLHRAGKGVVAHCKWPLDGGRVPPGNVMVKPTRLLGPFTDACETFEGKPGSPQLEFSILKALGHKVNGLVGLVLVGLHRRLLRLERLVFRLIGQSVLDREFQDGSRQRATFG